MEGDKLPKSTRHLSNPRGFLVVVCKMKGAVRKFSPQISLPLLSLNPGKGKILRRLTTDVLKYENNILLVAF